MLITAKDQLKSLLEAKQAELKKHMSLRESIKRG